MVAIDTERVNKSNNTLSFNQLEFDLLVSTNYLLNSSIVYNIGKLTSLGISNSYIVL